MKKYNFKVNSIFTKSDSKETIVAQIEMLKNSTLSAKLKTAFAEAIKNLETQLEENQDKFATTIALGTNAVVVESSRELTPEEITMFQEELKTKLRASREERVEVEPERRNLLGYTYETLGGTFTTPGSVLRLKSTQDIYRRIRERKSPHKVFTAPHVGIELEFYCPLDRGTLEKHLADAGLAAYVTVKNDVSIKPDGAGYEGHEVNILCREEYAKNIISKVCAVLNSPVVGARVNNSCGVHVHLDARVRNHKIMYYNLVSSLPLLNKLIPAERVNNRYCKTNTEKDFDQFLLGKNSSEGHVRRQAINGEAYSKFRTIEVRMHSGSTNAAKIINWVTLLTKIASVPYKFDRDVHDIDGLESYTSITKAMADYINARIEQLASKIKTVDADVTDTTQFETAV